MANSNGIITAPVRLLADVSSVLGVAGNLGYLCSNVHGRINKWSQAKPIRNSSKSAISFSSDLTRVNGQVWGMLPPKLINNKIYFNQMAYAIINSNGESTQYPNWVYQPPRGGENEPYRLLDFKGYNHRAQQPFSTGIQNEQTEYNLFDIETLVFYFMAMQGSDFSLSDFMGAFTEYYFTVEIYVESGTPWYAMTSPTYKYKSARRISEITDWAEYITLNINEIWDTASIVNKTVYAVLGMQNYSGSNPESNSGIIAPWTKGSSNYPFYKPIKFVNYFNRQFSSYQYAFNLINTTWYNVNDYEQVSLRGTNVFILRCRMQRKKKPLYIVPRYPSGVPSNTNQVKIRATISGSYTNQVYATPCNDTPGFPTVQYIRIESSSEWEPQDICLKFDALIKVGQTNTIIIEATADNEKTWVMLDAIGVNIVSNN